MIPILSPENCGSIREIHQSGVYILVQSFPSNRYSASIILTDVTVLYCAMQKRIDQSTVLIGLKCLIFCTSRAIQAKTKSNKHFTTFNIKNIHRKKLIIMHCKIRVITGAMCTIIFSSMQIRIPEYQVAIDCIIRGYHCDGNL